jgi:vancomycin resistance protein YoaR
MTFVNVPKPERHTELPATLSGLVIAAAVFFAGLVLLSGGYQMIYAGRIFPGINMAGVDLSGLTLEQAETELMERLIYPHEGQILFRHEDSLWVATPTELGMVFDIDASLSNVNRLGRQEGLLGNLATQINAWEAGLTVPPVILIDERIAQSYLQRISREIDRPVQEAALSLNGSEVVYTPGRSGALLDVDASLENLIAQLSTFRDGEVPLVIEQQLPLILAAEQQAASLRSLLSEPFVLTLPDAAEGDPGPWPIEPDVLAGMLVIQKVETDNGWQFGIGLGPQAVGDLLEQIAAEVDRTPENARFYFDDAGAAPTNDLVLIQSARPGRLLDAEATQAAVLQAIQAGDHTAGLVVELAEPQVGDDATATSLSISGLVSSYTSYFRGSSAARLQNIDAAAAQFHGLLIPPFTTFSMADAIGDISLENGYAEALIIFNGQTITGVGGGVCQVSTTLFRTAFYGGYPIDERHEHAYRVYYYEQTATGIDSSLAGLDATVYFPLVDLRFTNDRPSWLLMETYFNRSNYTLTWKFYSGDDGRSVQVTNLGLRNVVPAPAPRFDENPAYAPGACKQVDWPADGADITVIRSVYRDGTTLFSDSIETHYVPWQAVYQIGPGTDDPQALVDAGRCAH